MTTPIINPLAGSINGQNELTSVYTVQKVNKIVHSLYQQSSNKKGLIVGMPSTMHFIRTCAANLLHPNDEAIKLYKSKYEPIFFDGWIVVTQDTKRKPWMNVQGDNHTYTSKNTLTVPVYTIVTYETIGLLNELIGSIQNHLIIFEDAEYLIEILHKQKHKSFPTIYDVIQACKKSIFFTSNISLVDISDLQYVIDKHHTIPNTIRQIRNKYEKQHMFALSKFNELLLQPATRMMAQFIVVLGLVMNVRHVYFKNQRVHVKQSQKRRRIKKGKTLKHSGGLFFPSAQRMMNFVVDKLFVQVLSLPKMFFKAIWYTIKRNVIGENFAEHVQDNVSAFVYHANKCLFHKMHKTNLKTLHNGLRKGIKGVIQNMFHLHESELELVLSYLGVLALAWISSQIIKNYVRPTYNSSLTKDLKDSLCVACHEDSYSSTSRSMNTLFTTIKKRTVHYNDNVIPEMMSRTFELDNIKSAYAKHNVFQELLNVESEDKYNTCKKKFKNLHKNYALNNRLRIVVVVPEKCSVYTEPSDWVEKEDDGIFKEIKMSQINTMRKIPKRNLINGKQILFPAHEIHFITPPTNEERAQVVLIFAGIHYKMAKMLVRDPFGMGFHLSRDTNMSVTKLFEYIRPFTRLKSVVKGMEKTGSTTKHTMHKAYKYYKRLPKDTQKVSTTKHELLAPEWFSIALDNIMSPEEHVRQYRNSIENEWKQIESMLCSDDVEKSEYYALARELDTKYSDDELEQQQNRREKTKEKHNEILNLYKRAIDLHKANINSSNAEKIGKLTLQLENLKKKSVVSQR